MVLMRDPLITFPRDGNMARRLAAEARGATGTELSGNMVAPYRDWGHGLDESVERGAKGLDIRGRYSEVLMLNGPDPRGHYLLLERGVCGVEGGDDYLRLTALDSDGSLEELYTNTECSFIDATLNGLEEIGK